MPRLSSITVLALATILLVAASGCDAPTREQRQRDAAEEIQGGVDDPSEAALDQKVSPEVVKEVQRNLTVLNEYMGDITGKMDPVTVNAVQAFQRSVNDRLPWWQPWTKIDAEGIIDEQTRSLLAAAAKKA
jgi:peptidoglycan hydrolase-like protein with peptidoglycan-binding domain